VAGWFAQDFPEAGIQNISQNGEKISGLLNNFPDLKEHFRLVVIQIGANDIMRLTHLKNVKRQLSVAVDKSKAISDYVIMLYSGDVGFAPIFIWPLDDVYSSRSRAFNKIYMGISHEKGVMYVDLMKKRQDDPFLKDIKKFYSPDLLHPSGQGYRHWYDEIRKTLRENGVIL
jgi:lysophospholipase L1-like esterase